MSDRLIDPLLLRLAGLSGLVRSEDAPPPWLLPGIAISALVSVLVAGVVARPFPYGSVSLLARLFAS